MTIDPQGTETALDHVQRHCRRRIRASLQYEPRLPRSCELEFFKAQLPHLQLPLLLGLHFLQGDQVSLQVPFGIAND